MLPTLTYQEETELKLGKAVDYVQSNEQEVIGEWWIVTCVVCCVCSFCFVAPSSFSFFASTCGGQERF
jgi:hypothetical protein